MQPYGAMIGSRTLRSWIIYRFPIAFATKEREIKIYRSDNIWHAKSIKLSYRAQEEHSIFGTLI